MRVTPAKYDRTIRLMHVTEGSGRLSAVHGEVENKLGCRMRHMHMQHDGNHQTISSNRRRSETLMHISTLTFSASRLTFAT